RQHHHQTAISTPKRRSPETPDPQVLTIARLDLRAPVHDYFDPFSPPDGSGPNYLHPLQMVPTTTERSSNEQ
ncbi:hypothetical protein, partial [Mycobacteroides abscessus]|uniref:hypothetical protein n=1 Tax=Mycobacteroides abscessus TaxID=36809 RepID=UPI001A996C1B